MTDNKLNVAIFAAGCFWGVEDKLSRVSGVIQTEVGYTGGHTMNPTYKTVCSHTTGHAEAVKIQFDPSQISYEDLVKFFFDLHDPTTRDRQGPDVGNQYRSAIFYTSQVQRKVASQIKDKLNDNGRYNRPIVTEITEAGPFYRAEEYHQKYFQKTGRSSCRVL